MDLPQVDPTEVKSTTHDLMIDGCPSYGPFHLHGHMDLDWVMCLKTRRPMGGGGMQLAEGLVAWKTNLLKTIAQSLAEGEYIKANDIGKMAFFCAQYTVGSGYSTMLVNSPLRGQ